MPSRRQVLAGAGSAATVVAGCLGSENGHDAAADAAGDRTDWQTAGHDRANTNYLPDAPAIRGVTRANRVDSGLTAS